MGLNVTLRWGEPAPALLGKPSAVNLAGLSMRGTFIWRSVEADSTSQESTIKEQRKYPMFCWTKGLIKCMEICKQRALGYPRLLYAHAYMLTDENFEGNLCVSVESGRLVITKFLTPNSNLE